MSRTKFGIVVATDVAEEGLDFPVRGLNDALKFMLTSDADRLVTS